MSLSRFRRDAIDCASSIHRSFGIVVMSIQLFSSAAAWRARRDASRADPHAVFSRARAPVQVGISIAPARMDYAGAKLDFKT